MPSSRKSVYPAGITALRHHAEISDLQLFLRSNHRIVDLTYELWDYCFNVTFCVYGNSGWWLSRKRGVWGLTTFCLGVYPMSSNALKRRQVKIR